MSGRPFEAARFFLHLAHHSPLPHFAEAQQGVPKEVHPDPVARPEGFAHPLDSLWFGG